MGYLGGKSKGYEHIIKFLNNPKFNRKKYIEPFVGYANILRRVENKSSYSAYDINPYLITLLKYIKTKKPFPTITRKQYEFYRDTPFNKLDTTQKINASFAAFAYSYGGKMFGGYFPKHGNRNYAAESKRYYKQLQVNNTFMKSSFSRKDYKKLDPRGAIIYCDPPYKGTTGYRGTGEWNADEFWDVVRKWSKKNVVVVSEYSAPKDFICISWVAKKSSVGKERSKGFEKDCLFIHKSLKKYV